MPKKNPFKTAAAIAAILALSSLPGLAAQDTARAENRSSTSETYRALDLFGDVFEQVRANYVEKVEDRKLIEYALNGMLSSLDPHSAYMNEEETKSMSVQNRGEFGGLGIEVTMENGVVKVISPIDDTPASRAGVKGGDLIVEIDGKQVMGLSLSDAVDKMRGKPGSAIALTIIRKGAKEPIKLRLTRDVIQVQSVKSRVEKGNVGYIRITSFTAQTTPGLKKAFEEIRKDAGDKLIGYVLDLRNNPGGLLDEAISVSDAFLDKGEIVSTRGRNPDDVRRDNATQGDMAHGLPVVVLVNGASASASEIVAGALQDHKRAVVVGAQSFGKGSVQTLFNVPGGGSIRLTTARYYTPSGKSIQAKGITPDIVVEQAKVVPEQGTPFSEIHEKDLKGALVNPDGDSDPSGDPPAASPDGKPAKDKNDDKSGDKPDAEKKVEDYQLLRAVDLLQGLSVFRGAEKGDDAQPSQADPHPGKKKGD
jgi:carboxyl-terminal processing protease